MEEIRPHRLSDEPAERIASEEEREYETQSRDEVPFHIPRD